MGCSAGLYRLAKYLRTRICRFAQFLLLIYPCLVMLSCYFDCNIPHLQNLHLNKVILGRMLEYDVIGTCIVR